MFDTWLQGGGLSDLEVPATARVLDPSGANKATFAPGAAFKFRVTGAPNAGVLTTIQRGGAIIQAMSWEAPFPKTGNALGSGPDAIGAVEWNATAPTEPGSYRYTFTVSTAGYTYDPQASVDFTVVGAVNDDAIIEPGGGFHIPQSITIAGISMSPFMLLGVGVAAYFVLRGK